MSSEKLQRKLTSILSADVVGYSRLMGDDDVETVRTLTRYKEIIFKLIDQNNGRLIDSPGDNLLAEFASVVDTLKCALQVQTTLKENNEGLPVNRKMEFRIGINIGDVIQDGERLYGDGVNVAARIESLTDPGGVCLSSSAYDQVKRKIDVEYYFMGDQQVKNIEDPIQVYKVLMHSVPYDVVQGESSHGLISGEKKASIAVLPFSNLSADPEQEFFADGLSEEILNCLAKIPELDIKAKASSFSFKNTGKTIREIASVLDVEYILEGSVKKEADPFLRIAAQLVKADDGSHLWSETYKRELKEIFQILEDIALAVADKLKITFETDKTISKPGYTDKPEAYELFLTVQGQIWQESGRDLGISSRMLETLDKAITLDPEFALAWGLFSIIQRYFVAFGSSILAEKEMAAALKAAKMAVKLAPGLSDGYIALGVCDVMRGNWIDAEMAFRKAGELQTETLADSQYMIHKLYGATGYHEKLRSMLKKARQNDPLNTDLCSEYLLACGFLGDMQLSEKEYEQGIVLFGNRWDSGNEKITILRLGSRKNLSGDDIVYSSPIFNIAKETLDSPKEGLTELRRLYNQCNNLSEIEITDIMLWAAYFGDPELAMDAMEKGLKINAMGAFKIWVPVMKEVRQLSRFKEFLRQIGLVDYWNKFGWPDICRPVGDGDFVCD